MESYVLSMQKHLITFFKDTFSTWENCLNKSAVNNFPDFDVPAGLSGISWVKWVIVGKVEIQDFLFFDLLIFFIAYICE